MTSHMIDDDYEADDDILDLPLASIPSMDGIANLAGSSNERLIRKRSSKACDNCRKAKCKCERSPSSASRGEACKNCVVLGAECTFLGPSRKRGPPKGYIDALESKLHQLEALLGAIATSADPRARSLVYDISQDSLARSVIERIEDSPFGARGRKQAAASKELYGRGGSTPASGSNSGRRRGSPSDFTSGFANGTPHEWQDSLTDLIDSRAYEARYGASTAMSPSGLDGRASSSTPSLSDRVSPPFLAPPAEDTKPNVARSNSLFAYDDVNPNQRRRLNNGSPPLNLIEARGLGNNSSSTYSYPSTYHRRRTPPDGKHARSFARHRGPVSSDDESSDLADDIGQLSMNEHRQLRYHGKASGLHLLMPAMSYPTDRNHTAASREVQSIISPRVNVQAGIWEFPPAGVWPPAPAPPPLTPRSSHLTSTKCLPERKHSEGHCDIERDAAAAVYLPPRNRQEHLIGLYFTYVHPIVPLVHRGQFWRDFGARNDQSSPIHLEARMRLSNVLLLTIFAVAERYSNHTPPPENGKMWTAGNDHLERARDLIITMSSLSRPDVVQALLLLGYREIGMGTMAQAWLYLGMAIRVAQDLGLHRSIAKWQLSGQKKISAEDKETRARIWHACVRMDKYVSTYIGRPLTVYEHDYDTQLPEEDEEEENELWGQYPSFPSGVVGAEDLMITQYPQPSRVISCFKASISCSMLLGSIVFNLYAIRQPSTSSRHRERQAIEQKLERWLLELPEHLQMNITTPQTRERVPSPHVLTLHMQYWCTLLLLNRPFIRIPDKRDKRSPSPLSSSSLEQEEIAATASKCFASCQTAAHHITNIGMTFAESFCIKRAPAIFTYYIFSASIMHVTSLMESPGDVQASAGLQKSMDILNRMSVIWPSATRAWDLLSGVKIDVGHVGLAALSNAPERKKRPAVDTEFSSPSYGQPIGTSRSSAMVGLGLGPTSTHPPSSAHHPPPSSFAAYIPHQTDSHAGLHQSSTIYDGWTSQNGSPGYTPASLSVSQSLSGLPQMSQYDSYDTTSMGSISAPYASRLGSTPSQPHSPYQDTFAPSPVPGSASTGVHSGYWVADPYADPSLLSSYGSVSGLPTHQNVAHSNLEPSLSSQSIHHHPQSLLPSSYAVLDPYFNGADSSTTSPAGPNYYGGEQLRHQREPMAMF